MTRWNDFAASAGSPASKSARPREKCPSSLLGSSLAILRNCSIRMLSGISLLLLRMRLYASHRLSCDRGEDAVGNLDGFGQITEQRRVFRIETRQLFRQHR